MAETIGMVTMGQAPRTDLTPDVVAHLPDGVEVVEVGALDGFDSAAAVEDAIGPREGRPVMVPPLRDGTQATVDREGLLGLAQERIRDVEAEASVVAVLCAGHSPGYQADATLVEPGHLLQHWVEAIDPEGPVGVLVPDDRQIAQTRRKWGGVDVVVGAANPYADADEVTPAARALDGGLGVVAMDCMGYTEAAKRVVAAETGARVLLARSVLGRTLAELV